MNKVFEPISDKLICKPVEQDEVSAGGIILPELDDQKTLKEKYSHYSTHMFKASDDYNYS